MGFYRHAAGEKDGSVREKKKKKKDIWWKKKHFKKKLFTFEKNFCDSSSKEKDIHIKNFDSDIKELETDKDFNKTSHGPWLQFCALLIHIQMC